MSPIPRPQRRLRLRLWRHEGGIAAVEFALILPILLLLWIGGVEVTSGLSVDRRIDNLASSIGDLVARTKQISYASIENIFDVAPGAMFPYGVAGMTMRITAVDVVEGDATVAWSRARGAEAAYVRDASLNDVVPEALRPDVPTPSQLIMAEVYYTYRPAVGYVITGELQLQDRMFFVPRLSPKVKICPTDEASCVDEI